MAEITGAKLSEKAERGLAVVRDMIGTEAEAGLRQLMTSDAFGSGLMIQSMEHTYGEVWSRGVLTPRECSLVMLALLIDQRAAAALKYHIIAALNNGLTPAEIEEVLRFVTPYVGTPATQIAANVAKEVLEGK